MINGTNKLDTVKQAFRHWRATRTKRGQIPDEYGSRSRDYWVIILLRKSAVI